MCISLDKINWYGTNEHNIQWGLQSNIFLMSFFVLSITNMGNRSLLCIYAWTSRLSFRHLLIFCAKKEVTFGKRKVVQVIHRLVKRHEILIFEQNDDKKITLHDHRSALAPSEPLLFLTCTSKKLLKNWTKYSLGWK